MFSSVKTHWREYFFLKFCVPALKFSCLPLSTSSFLWWSISPISFSTHSLDTSLGREYRMNWVTCTDIYHRIILCYLINLRFFGTGHACLHSHHSPPPNPQAKRQRVKSWGASAFWNACRSSFSGMWRYASTVTALRPQCGSPLKGCEKAHNSGHGRPLYGQTWSLCLLFPISIKVDGKKSEHQW